MTVVRNEKRLALCALLLLLLLPQGARCEQSWRQGFDETCSKTQEAMKLSVPELTALLEKCAQLQKAIETEEESVRKVYLKRLQMCKNLYSYVLDYKKNPQSTK